MNFPYFLRRLAILSLAMVSVARAADDGPLRFEGVMQPLHQFEVKAEVNGRVKKMSVDFNFNVKTGALLLEIEDASGVTKVLAPADGTVVGVDVKPGQAVVAGGPKGGSPLLTIMDLDQMVMTVNVPESAMSRIAKGQAVRITTPSYPGRDFEGTIRSVAATATVIKGVRYFEVQVLMDNSDWRIKPGMTGDMILVSEAQRRLRPKQKGWVHENTKRHEAQAQGDGERYFQASGVSSGNMRTALAMSQLVRRSPPRLCWVFMRLGMAVPCSP
jgi:multidrug efflux pump subunit AcrA (membrane-fusion protein)